MIFFMVAKLAVGTTEEAMRARCDVRAVYGRSEGKNCLLYGAFDVAFAIHNHHGQTRSVQ